MNHRLLDDSDADSLNPNMEFIAAIDGQQLDNTGSLPEGFSLKKDRSDFLLEDRGAHGMEMQGAHGLVGVRVSSNQPTRVERPNRVPTNQLQDVHGAHGLVEVPTRVANPLPGSISAAVPHGRHGSARVGDLGMGGAPARVDTAGHSSRVAFGEILGLDRNLNASISGHAHLPRAIAPIASKSGYTIIDSSAKVASCDDAHAKTISRPAPITGRGVGPSFAQVLGNSAMHGQVAPAAMHVTNIAPESSKPSLKGNYICVEVNEAALLNQLELCQFSLIGRIFLSKGDSPWKLVDLKFKLQTVWSLSSLWRLISLGRGFFHILLSSEADKAKVWGLGSLNLKLGVPHLQSWFSNFNPHTRSSTNAQVRVHFHELCWVYWDRQNLSDLARGVGIPIRFDEMILKGEFGHYARMLIDIDLSQPISDSLMVEVGNDCLFIPLEYERLPSFCSSYKFIGHEASNCRRIHKQVLVKDGEKRQDRGRSRSCKAVFRPVTKSPTVNNIQDGNTFTLLKKGDQGVSNLSEHDHVFSPSQADMTKKKSWAEDLEDLENQVVLNQEGLIVDTSNVVGDTTASTGTLPLNQCNENTSKDPLEDQIRANSQGKDSSSFQESTNDSFNTSDLSPTKVFALKDEGWQEVQSEKKKKASQAQFTRPFTRSSRTISQFKILYWNCRGVSNLETRRSLKDLCIQYRPDLLCLAEPMCMFSSIPIRY
ncbi:Endonuclease/exonuclease/phosphatase [Trema orientale]|uniref:Endonuclease/exonuclease/phosphatase n=1 Tax=Trema orientale TaxID=63057 RepID=A0A2P5B269_TREOI|nr:Endonuclease/exonuclease/phosphatase [Trema orientale]